MGRMEMRWQRWAGAALSGWLMTVTPVCSGPALGAGKTVQKARPPSPSENNKPVFTAIQYKASLICVFSFKTHNNSVRSSYSLSIFTYRTHVQETECPGSHTRRLTESSLVIGLLLCFFHYTTTPGVSEGVEGKGIVLKVGAGQVATCALPGWLCSQLQWTFCPPHPPAKQNWPTWANTGYDFSLPASHLTPERSS